MSANRQIHVPAEMKGLKMRINSSKVNAAIMKSVGAIPQTMAFSEVYQALDTGVVDGTEGPLSNLYTQKQYEVQKHVTLTYPHDQQLRRRREQEVLGRPAAGHPHDARRRDEGCDQVQRPGVGEGRSDGHRRHQGLRQVDDLYADAAPRRSCGSRRCCRCRTKWRRASARTPSPRSARATGVRKVTLRSASRPGRAPADAPRRREQPGGDGEDPRPIRRDLHFVPDGRGDAADFRRRRPSLRHRLADSRRAGSDAEDRPVLGAGAVHHHVRVDGQVRRRVRRAHRHPRRRRRADQPARGSQPLQVHRLRPAGRRAVHRHRRHAGRAFRVGERRALRVLQAVRRQRQRHVPGSEHAGPRMADVDGLFGHPARLLAHVLPLPAGAGQFRPHRRAAASRPQPRRGPRGGDLARTRQGGPGPIASTTSCIRAT